MVKATWIAARPQWYFWSIGLTNRVQPYCRLAIITMQMMPKISWPQRVPSDAVARTSIALVVLVVVDISPSLFCLIWLRTRVRKSHWRQVSLAPGLIGTCRIMKSSVRPSPTTEAPPPAPITGCHNHRSLTNQSLQPCPTGSHSALRPLAKLHRDLCNTSPPPEDNARNPDPTPGTWCRTFRVAPQHSVAQLTGRIYRPRPWCPDPKFAPLCGTHSFANFGIEGHQQLIDSSVALVQKSASRTRCKDDADF